MAGNTISNTRSIEKLSTFRTLLLIKIMQDNPRISWISRLNFDRTKSEGFFFCGITTTAGQIQFQIPDVYWDLASQTFAKVLNVARHPDDISSDETIRRLTNWISYQRKNSNKGIKGFSDFIASPNSPLVSSK